MQPNLSLRRQCELLAVGRSGLYYEPVGTSAEELALMRRIDVIHLKWAFYGARKLCEVLRAEGTSVTRKRMQRIMRVMGLESVAPKPGTSEPHPEHPVFPYLLRNLAYGSPQDYVQPGSLRRTALKTLDVVDRRYTLDQIAERVGDYVTGVNPL